MNPKGCNCYIGFLRFPKGWITPTTQTRQKAQPQSPGGNDSFIGRLGTPPLSYRLHQSLVDRLVQQTGVSSLPCLFSRATDSGALLRAGYDKMQRQKNR